MGDRNDSGQAHGRPPPEEATELTPDDALRRICRDIVELAISDDEWSAIESDDYFQEEGYAGGFDATEREFCFETQIQGREYWFQFDLATAKKIADDGDVTLLALPAR